MRLVCAWCNKVLAEGSPEDLTSHGICDDCVKEVAMPIKTEMFFEHDLTVVGLQFRNKKDEREKLAKALRALPNGRPVELVREQENKFDINAIAVKFTKAYGGKHIGYIGRESAAVLASLMDDGDLVFKRGALMEVTGKTFNEGLAHIVFIDKRKRA